MTDKKMDQLLMQALSPNIHDEETKVRLNERKETTMMKFNTRRMGILIACICLFAGITVFAAGKIESLQTGKNYKAFTKYEDYDKAVAKAGYQIAAPEQLNDEYIFKEYSIVGTDAKDSDNNTVSSFKEFKVTYEDKKGDQLVLNTLKSSDYQDEDVVKPDEICNINGVSVSYTTYRMITVPDDYELTAKEKAMQETGKIWFTKGGFDNREETEYAFVSWEKDGIRYNLMDEGLKMQKESLFQMAENVLMN